MFKLLMVINKKLLIIVNNVYVCQSAEVWLYCHSSDENNLKDSTLWEGHFSQELSGRKRFTIGHWNVNAGFFFYFNVSEPFGEDELNNPT